MPEKIRVLIVDDVAITRENIKKLMEFHPEVEAVGQAGTGEEAISLCRELKPDVLLLDLDLPIPLGRVGSGFDVALALRLAAPPPPR